MRLALMECGSEISHLNSVTLLLVQQCFGLTISLLFALERTRSITVRCSISCLSITGCGSKLKTRSFVWNMFLLFLCGLMFLQNRLRQLHTREFARFLGLHLN